MINAKEELIQTIGEIGVIAAAIDLGDEPQNKKTFRLKQNHSNADWLNFLNQLDFKYDDGYGGQELFGTVWLSDGTWLERGEYDGSEWWEKRMLPEIPQELK